MSRAVPDSWWRSAVVYQIYPLSYADSNGDGFGDLNGIHSKLDYLKTLGVDVIWLSPIYKSPLADMGYDIADYRAIDPRYGTMEDWDCLIEGVHARGMKLLMDLVVNHTSDEHEWFVKSRSSKDNNMRDWYIWRPPKYDSENNRKPPNNWRAVFRGSVWEFDEGTDEYYLHLFLTKQPDLNWDNEDVRTAVHDMMKFWLNKGCDGFRMDVINLISKTEGLPDAPVVDPNDFTQPAHMHYANGPRVHPYLKDMNKEVLSHYDIMTVGEAPLSHSASDLAKYVLPENHELNMVFQFELMDIDAADPDEPLTWKKWTLPDLEHIVAKWQIFDRDQGFWNAVYIENHDHARAVSRYGNDSPQWRALSAKMLAILQVTQSGTMYIYQGQEIAMSDFPITWGIEEYKDPVTIAYWNKILTERQKANPGKEIDMSDILTDCQRKARDHARIPMQWDASPSAGFSTGNPWMRVNDDYESWNVQLQSGDPTSVLSFYQRALALRKKYVALIYGEFEMLSKGHPKLMAYSLRLDDFVAVVVLNFSEDIVAFGVDSSSVPLDRCQLVLRNYGDELNGSPLQPSTSLHGYEGRVYTT